MSKNKKEIYTKLSTKMGLAAIVKWGYNKKFETKKFTGSRFYKNISNYD